jgi:hypothetical protein
MYLVIRTGYEGIEELNWLTSDPGEAINKAKLLQIVCVKELIDHAYKFDDDDSDEIIIEEISEKEIQHAKDFVCIQKWTGDEFICACAELGISPSESMFR